MAAATTASTAASSAATIATTALARAQAAFNAAATIGGRVIGGLKSGMSALAAALGGPVNIAITGIVIAMTLLATRTDEALDAAQRFKTAQEEAASKIDGVTAAVQNQTQSYRDLVAAQAAAGVARAKEKKESAAQSLASSLETAALDLNPFGGDAARLKAIAARLRAGQNSGTNYSELNAIQKRNPRAFEGSRVLGFLGANPGDVADKSAGFVQTDRELAQARQEARDAEKRAGQKLKPIDLNGPQRRSTAQLKADADTIATGGTALLKARAEFAKTQADLDAELKKHRDAGDNSFDDTYVQRLAAAQSKLNAVGDAQRAAAKGATEHRKAIAEQNRTLKAAESAFDKVADIQNRYRDEPSARRRADNDKADLDALFTRIKDGKVQVQDSIQLLNRETGKLEPFTRADAENVKANIERGLNRPLAEALRDQDREFAVSQLILAGRADEAELLRQKQDLISRGVNEQSEEFKQLGANAKRQADINRAIEQRNRLIDIQAKAYGTVQGAIQDTIANPFSGKGLGSTFKGLRQAFSQQLAEGLTFKLFGDPEQDYRDKMTRGLNDSADRLKDSATALTDAAAALSGEPGYTPLSQTRAPIDADDATARFEDAIKNYGNIVVSARREDVQKAKRQKPESTEERFNRVGKEFAEKVFGKGSILTKAAGKLGSFLSGARYAPVGTGIQSLFGGKSSSLGAAIGGGLGKTILGGTGGLLAKGLSSISSSLGQFAGPLGSIAGSVIGSVVGGLFKKTKQASSTVSVNAKGVSSSTGQGTGANERQTATGLGSGVSSGISKIAEALGGSLGSASISIGYRPGHKAGAYRVDTSGQGKLTGVQAFETEQEAIEYAIVQALKQGAIAGVREGTKRLLAAGTDLDTALQKALDFQNVFRELKQYTDPVGAAIDDLNTQFKRLIDIFNEAGASSQEFQDLQKLYDLKRVDAIKQATDSAISNIQDFINGLKGGSESPLSRRTVYNNASQEVAGFRADLAAGKVVDNDKLLAALGRYQEASSKLNGTRSAFFADFNDILSLAEKAKSNVESATASNGNYASPFDAVVRQNTSDMVTLQQQTIAELQNLTRAVSSGGGGSAVNGSSFAFLPAMSSR